MARRPPPAPRLSENPRYDRELREKVIALAGAGMSVRRIAAEVGRSPTRVAALLDELGVKTRRAS